MLNKLKAIVDNMQMRRHGNKRRWKRQKTPNCDYISELFINSLSLPTPKETRIMRRKRSEIYLEATRPSRTANSCPKPESIAATFNIERYGVPKSRSSRQLSRESMENPSPLPSNIFKNNQSPLSLIY